MKFAISISALFLLLGMTVSTYAMQEKGQEDHQQEAKPAQKEAKPAQQHTQQQSKVPQRQHAQKQAQPAQQQHAQTQAKPAPPKRTQQAARTQRPQTQTANRSQQHNGGQARVQQTRAANVNRGAAHGRIPDARYRSSFGSGHRFHINQSDYQHRRFQYGGYTFGFIDPWPVGWAYSDDVYVEYVDGGYYMYDPVHPGLRISISIQ